MKPARLEKQRGKAVNECPPKHTLDEPLPPCPEGSRAPCTCATERTYAQLEASEARARQEAAEAERLLARRTAELVRSKQETEDQYENLRRISDAMPDGVYITDENYDIQYANARFQAELGDYHGRKCYAYFYQRTSPCPWCRNRDVLSGRTIRSEFHSEEKQRIYDVIATPIRLVSSGRTGKLQIFRDITERKQIEKDLRLARDQLEGRVRERTVELEETGRRLQAVLQQMPAGVVLAEAPSGRLILANEKMEAILRRPFIPARDFAHYAAYGGCHADGRPYEPEEWPLARSILHGETVIGEEIEIERGDATRGVIRVSSAPIRDAKGKVKSAVAVFDDITELRQTEVARSAAELELSEQRALSLHGDRLRSLGQMAAGIAHELNQPLTGVRALAEQNLIGLREGWDLDREALAQELSMIVQQADRMDHVIEHVRMFAREAGRPETQRIDVSEVAASALDLVRAQFAAHGLALELRTAENLPRVLANPFSLEEVLLNLVTNARYAVEERLTAEPHADTRIILRTGLDPAGGERPVRIEVIDFGAGMSRAVLERALEPFFTTRGPGEGTGLGLSVCKGLLDDVGGSLHIESMPGVGTTVTISLPAAE